jgi:hypothetical protein
MNAATYSLLTLRPDPERVDVVCVGAVVRAADGAWHVLAPPAAETKLQALGSTNAGRLGRMAENLRTLLGACGDFPAARALLQRAGGSLILHDFEGVFAYDSLADFNAQLESIVRESVTTPQAAAPTRVTRTRAARPHTRARLKQHFENMGILARDHGEISEHKVVRNYPVSTQHGLVAEFALSNSVMHITETVDFDVAEDSVRNKKFEAQAKCLVMRAAKDAFGPRTECYVVVSGSGADHAQRTIDLLSTAGRLFATENQDDMHEYLERIAHAARSTGQLN